MQKNILNKLKNLQIKYKKNGFLLIGVFGSQARGEATEESDIDIVYDIDKKILSNYSGWNAIMQLETIKKEIQETLNIFQVDLASIDNNSVVFQNSLKNDLLYV